MQSGSHGESPVHGPAHPILRAVESYKLVHCPGFLAVVREAGYGLYMQHTGGCDKCMCVCANGVLFQTNRPVLESLQSRYMTVKVS